MKALWHRIFSNIGKYDERYYSHASHTFLTTIWGGAVVVAVHKYYVGGMKKVVQLSIGVENNRKKKKKSLQPQKMREKRHTQGQHVR